MKTIEINTSQNVKIEYQLASTGHRIFAFVIDFIIMAFVGIIFSFSVMVDSINSGIIEELFLTLWFGFFSLFSELIGNGQSIGKRVMGIKIIKINGGELSFEDYFSRWSMRLIDIYFSLGTIATILIVSSKNGQRLGDVLAGTTVIMKRSDLGFRLSDILKLNLKSKDSHEFEYPLAHRLKEQEVVLIKNLIYRSRNIKNKAHDEAKEKMVNRLMEILELDEKPNNTDAFLSKVISEYIILTR
jgi:uncharacterized RDD family membrane protein YckC